MSNGEYHQLITFSNEEEMKNHIAKDLIEKELGFPIPVPTGYHMYIAIHTREEDMHKMKDDEGNVILDSDGNPRFLALPSTVSEREKFTS